MEGNESISLPVVPTLAKAVRAKCLDCAGGSQAEVRRCHIREYALWPYRFGCRPATAAKRGNDVGQPKT